MLRLRERIRELAVRAGLAGVPEPVVFAGLAIFAVVCLFAAVRAWQAQSAYGEAPETGLPVAHRASETSPALRSPEATSLVVDVAGAVRRPGIVRLRSGSRVADAIAAAGGARPDAQVDGVNLARKVVDGEQILVAGPGVAVSVAEPGASGSPVGSGAAASTPGGKVDLNMADEAALDALPGVGPSTAKRIVDDRTANGAFKRVEDLMRVAGIGPKKFDALKDLVTVGP